ncbi:MAG: hypothetical protein SPK18_10080 [Treponema sp.]|nr:hypothetical protein [Spirochaetia bacterium]MDD7533200.1 hypothetical protein [Treponema sp.]MDY5758915.1 hypothetical protein [Treponema sp.]MDY5819451.1 hypothetical protein [Treponema sp.]
MKKIICIFFLFSIIILNLFSQNHPLQQAKKHANKPMQIMGITYNSTLSQVKKQFNEWNIVYHSTDANNGIQIENITWQGIVFEWINIFYDKRSGQITHIQCSPSQSESKDNITSSFNQIVVGLPFREVIESYVYGVQFNTYIYNGKDSSECAVFVREKSMYWDRFYFSFYFNGQMPDSYKE